MFFQFSRRWMVTLIIVVVLFASRTFAVTVSGVSGTKTHGGTITISGSDFGSKSPAAPVLWDDGSDDSRLNIYYSEHQPTNAAEGSIYNMAYRSSSFLSGRGISAPHSRMRYVLAGAHACSNVQPDDDCAYSTGNSVHLTVPIPGWPPGDGGNPRIYAQYWMRLDPSYDEVCTSNNPTFGCYNYTSGGENCKQFNISNSATMAYGSSWGYAQICNADCPDINFTGRYKFSRGSTCGDSMYSCSGNGLVYHTTNPVNNWVQFMWLWGYDNACDAPQWEITTLPDGHRTYRTYNGNPLTTYEILFGPGYPKDTEMRSINIGTFARVPRFYKGVNSFRYFGGIYVDKTWSRVMLCNNSTYANATICEPQIPTAWASSSITATVNQGGLSAGSVYLFVFDGQNNHNSIGYPVTIGGTLDIPPGAPSGLSILEGGI